jgi:hypothetical protein
MAFLVCYSQSLKDHPNVKAIYLDQRFYMLIFSQCCRRPDTFSVLHEMALLRYKSPTVLVCADKLDVLINEIDLLIREGFSHPQFAEFSRVCSEAKKINCALTISGDMYPELNP